MIRIGIDASGGDYGHSVITAGVEAVMRRQTVYTVVLYTAVKYTNQEKWPLLEVVRCRSANDELRTAFRDMADGRLQAVVTATNSRRLMGTIADYLRPDVPRPGYLAPFPTNHPTGISYAIDVGATAKDNNPETFAGWSIIGREFLERHLLRKEPKIGLLNIAKEHACPEIRAIDEHLRANSVLGYLGYVEPTDFFSGDVDLLLVDGFGGNVEVKSCEAYGRDVIIKRILEELKGKKQRKAMSIVEALRDQLFSYEAHLVAPVLGLAGGAVFRIHGKTTVAMIPAAFHKVFWDYNISLKDRI